MCKHLWTSVNLSEHLRTSVILCEHTAGRGGGDSHTWPDGGWSEIYSIFKQIFLLNAQFTIVCFDVTLWTLLNRLGYVNTHERP